MAQQWVPAVQEMMLKVSESVDLQNELKNDPVKGLEKVANLVALRPLDTDVWIYRIVVIVLGITILGTVFGGFWLASTSTTEIPQAMVALGSGALGALAGLLAPSPATGRS